MKTIQPKKQQRQQLQQQNLPLVLVIALLKDVDGLEMAIVMMAQTIWIATLTVEIAVAPMLKYTIAQVFKYEHMYLYYTYQVPISYSCVT